MDFDAERRELIEAILEPLPESETVRESLELAVAAGTALMRPGAGAAAVARMRTTAPSFASRRRWSLVATAGMLAIAAWFSALGPQAVRELCRIAVASRLGAWNSYMAQERPPLIPSLSIPRQDYDEVVKRAARLSKESWRVCLPLDDIAARGNREGTAYWKDQWRASPQDPALYFAFASAYWSEKQSWPDGFVATGEKLDPGNGWFRLCQAQALTLGVVKRNKRNTYWETFDHPRVARALSELSLAAQAQRLDDYRATLRQRFFKNWPGGADLPDQEFLLAFSNWLPYGRDNSFGAGEAGRLLAIAVGLDLDAAAASSRSEDLDEAAMRFRHLCSELVRMPGGYGGRQASRGIVQQGAWRLGLAYGNRKRPVEESEWWALQGEMKLLAPVWSQPDITRKGGVMARIYTSDIAPTILSDAELQPGRMADYAMYERYLWYVMAWLMTGAATISLFRLGFRRRRWGRLPERLADFSDWRDLPVAAVWALAPPALIYFAATRGMEDWHGWFLSLARFTAMACQFMGMATWVFLMTPLVLRWLALQRIGQAGPFLTGQRLLALALAALSLATIPASIRILEEFQLRKMEPEAGVYAVLSMAGLPVLWLLAMRFKIRTSVAALLSAAEAKACAPVYGLAALLALAGIAMAHREEKDWVSRMAFESSWSERGALISPVHQELAEKIRTKILESLKED